MRSVTATLAFADTAVFATLVAVTVCVPAVAGGEYTPADEIVPTAALPPAVPSTDQVTPVLAVPLTAAVKL
ncbi:MAG: hypothetical protein KGJ68_04610 [Gammaproteobacteria bacterium]|nr:hypothetical protein [Gammaproteobacteria bacterium]